MPTVLEPSGPVQACNGFALPLPLPSVGQNSSVGTGWPRTGRSGDRIPVAGGDFPHTFRSALRSTQCSIQRVPGHSRGEKRPGSDVNHLLDLVSRLKKE